MPDPPPDAQGLRADPALLRSVDSADVAQCVPVRYRSLFAPASTSFQPHLDKLRTRKRKLKEALSTGDLSLTDDAPLVLQDCKAKRKVAAHGLLRDAEKKANHIASEQKRRANIRKGYEMLSSMLPNAHSDTTPREARTSEDEQDVKPSSYNEMDVLTQGSSTTHLRQLLTMLRTC